MIVVEYGVLRVERIGNRRNPIDDRQHCGDQRLGGDQLVLPNRIQGVFGGMAERREARKIEKAATALDGVDEAKDAVERLPVIGRTLPGDHGPFYALQRLACFRDKIVKKIVHRSAR